MVYHVPSGQFERVDIIQIATREKLGDATFSVQAVAPPASQAQQRARVASVTRAPVAASRPQPSGSAANRGSKSTVITKPKQQNRPTGAAAAAAAQ